MVLAYSPIYVSERSLPSKITIAKYICSSRVVSQEHFLVV